MGVNVEVTIGRLVVHGLAGVDGTELGMLLRAELCRVLAGRALPVPGSDRALGALDGGAVEVSSRGRGSGQLAARIANVVHDSIAGGAPRPPAGGAR